ncbi:fatty acid desaturase [Colletotrichum gloeosporioides Cg-14]|uniref:Fatty acid desaturase n=1 Tax=Colletotrichum gloeosporioides (strain Cg-14) TaxID=1237896 RepID=T0LRD7_COLGC|nr:fatty acid desaturase [Colletotrichum gloeosporioides Cg-14]
MFPSEEPQRTGFDTAEELHPTEFLSDRAEKPSVKAHVGIKELRQAIPAHCFKPNHFWSFLYLFRDLSYATLLFYLYAKIPEFGWEAPYLHIKYFVLLTHSFVQGLVWTGLWIIAHECGHSAFSTISAVNDIIGLILHSFLLAPYFSWKSTHRRHHIYAGNMEKDHNYVPPLRNEYAAKLSLEPGKLDELGEDAPAWLFFRIVLQQTVGWVWYVLTNIACAPSAVIKPGMPFWRHSHLDPWGSLFRSSEVTAVIISDIGCFSTLVGLWLLYKYTGTFSDVFWLWIAPWMWVNHWIVMITYLHHTHPDIPKYTPEEWTFVLGATATMDRYFSWPWGFIGVHFFHNISTDHVVHHLFSKIPHYYAREATNAIVPVLGQQYNRGNFSINELVLSFTRCQWVEGDEMKDEEYFTTRSAGDKKAGSLGEMPRGLWYRGGPSPAPEYKMRMGTKYALPSRGIRSK